MADAGGSWAGAAAIIAQTAVQIKAMERQAEGVEMRIEEGIADYAQSIKDIQARSAEVSGESQRRIGAAKEEGILSLKEQGARAAHEGRVAMTTAEMTASSEEAKLGASGVRAKGSPLLAAQQNVDLAFAAADRTIESGKAGMKLGGVQLKNTMAGIGAEETMLTSEYLRKQTEMQRKKTELEQNKSKMKNIAFWGGMPGLASTFYSGGKDMGWF